MLNETMMSKGVSCSIGVSSTSDKTERDVKSMNQYVFILWVVPYPLYDVNMLLL